MLHRSYRISVDRLVEAEWNANRVKPGTLKKIRESIERYGIVENLVARQHPTLSDRFEVLSGNHRLRILRDLGHEKVPVVIVDVDDAHARLLAQTLNRTRGQDDPEAYAALIDKVLATLPASEAIAVLPETVNSLDRLLDEWKPRESATGDAVPDRPERPRSKPGQVYELGPHRLMCGDATNPEHLERLFAGERPDLVLTDPPYGVHYGAKTRALAKSGRGKARRDIAGDDLNEAQLEQLLVSVFGALAGRAACGCPIYAFHSERTAIAVRSALTRGGWAHKQTLIWVKNGHVLGRQDYQWKHEPILYGWKPGGAHRWYGHLAASTVFDDDGDPRDLTKQELLELVSELRRLQATTVLREDRPHAAELHPTMKPVALLRRLMINSSERDDIVVDPFAGSGSTLIAAEQTGRRCFAIELDRGYCDVIRDRYQALTAERSACAAAA